MNRNGKIYNVLFLGNGNSGRSIMAEAILNRESRGRFRAFSAGIQAHEEFDARAIELMASHGLPTPTDAPKAWNEFTGPDAPEFDYIFTLCESATLLPRAMWKGNPQIANWVIPNPALADGNEAEIRIAYSESLRSISNMVTAFACLPLEPREPGARKASANKAVAA